MKSLKAGKHIHIIGVGGISMSGIAKWCISEGFEVSGSDKTYSETIDELKVLGIRAYVGSREEEIKAADTIVYSSAVPECDAELLCARNTGKIVYERHAFLAEIGKEFNNVIAVGGTHGKTTTTALTATMFLEDGKNFSAHLGGESLDLGGNFYIGGKDYFISEACEYKQSLLSFTPDCAVVLNVESDHPDCYESIEALRQTFAKFVDNTQKNGFIVINGALEYLNFHKCTNAHMLTFGYEQSFDCYAANISEHGGKCEYDVFFKQEYYGRIKSSLYGRHNIMNTLAAITVAECNGIERSAAIRAAKKFRGVKRRFEFVKMVNGARVVLDYAHHPSEITATIETAKKLSYRNLRVYFQPHTYSRTAKFFNEFAAAFSGVDDLSFVATYPARETPEMGKSAFELSYFVNANIAEAKYYDNLISAAAGISATAMPDDLILILGAGDIADIVKLL
jgi:UDP-N-acetylmuramate--alanine ligase